MNLSFSPIYIDIIYYNKHEISGGYDKKISWDA